MARTKGSKNKATLAREVQDQVDIQDRDHLNTQNEQVLAVINGITQPPSESEYETSYDESDNDATFHPPIEQPPLEESSQKSSHAKPSTSKKAEKKSTQVTTLKLSTTKTSGHIKKHVDAGLIMEQNLAAFRRQLEAQHNHQFELTNVNVRNLSDSLERYGAKYERDSNHMLKMMAQMRTQLETVANFTKFNTPLAIKKVI